MWAIVVQYAPALVNGVFVTLGLAAIVWAAGIGFGSFVGWAAHRSYRVLGRTLGLVSFVAASIPVIVILFWAHYPLQVLLGVVVDPFVTAAAVLSLANILAVAVIVKNALDQFPKEFIAAARVAGLSSQATNRYIRLPLILRQITPALLSSQVVVLQSTLFASMISVDEILRVAQRINATEYKPIQIYSAVALFFLVLCAPLNAIAAMLHRRYARDFSAR